MRKKRKPGAESMKIPVFPYIHQMSREKEYFKAEGE